LDAGFRADSNLLARRFAQADFHEFDPLGLAPESKTMIVGSLLAQVPRLNSDHQLRDPIAHGMIGWLPLCVLASGESFRHRIMAQNISLAQPSYPPPLASHPQRLTPRQWLLLVLIFAYGIGLRGWHLDKSPLITDEAETSINSLTILQHGVPRDQYLGLPIFENTLGKPWADNHEYEFRDTSYSEQGLAIYHGWLPPYAVAASLALHGIEPDTDQSRLSPRYSEEAIRQRIRVARTPAVLLQRSFWSRCSSRAGSYLGMMPGGRHSLRQLLARVRLLWLGRPAITP
jgi:hypothetical protein